MLILVSMFLSTQFSSTLSLEAPRNKDFLLFALVTRFSLEDRKPGKKVYRWKLRLVYFRQDVFYFFELDVRESVHKWNIKYC